MKKITIPKKFGYPTMDIMVNFKRYTLETGKEIEVDDGLAEVIENAIAFEPKQDSNIDESKTATVGTVLNQSYFRGWASTNAEIKSLTGTPNDFAYSVESGTVWKYKDGAGWYDTHKLVPALGASVDFNGAESVEDGTGAGAVQQVADGVEDGFDFTNKNPNATGYDPSLTGTIPYGATGDYASAFGGKSSAQGKRSNAEGTTTIAKGNYSHSEGNSTVAIGTNSHAEGAQTTAYGGTSHAEGQKTVAKGEVSHAEGISTLAEGVCSHAEGESTEAIGANSHAEGTFTKATHYNSHASGYYTKTGRNSQTVCGEYNEGKENTIFEVGNGSKDKRSNALEVMDDGRVKAHGAPKDPEDVVRLGDFGGQLGGGVKLYMHDISFKEVGCGPEDKTSKMKIISTKSTPFTSLSENDFLNGSIVNAYFYITSGIDTLWSPIRGFGDNVVHLHGSNAGGVTVASVTFTAINIGFSDTVTEL